MSFRSGELQKTYFINLLYLYFTHFTLERIRVYGLKFKAKVGVRIMKAPVLVTLNDLERHFPS